MFRNCGREPDLTQPDRDGPGVHQWCGRPADECRTPRTCDQYERLGRVCRCECGAVVGDDETECESCAACSQPLLELADRIEALGREFSDCGATDSFLFASIAERTARDLRAQAGCETVGV